MFESGSRYSCSLCALAAAFALLFLVSGDGLTQGDRCERPIAATFSGSCQALKIKDIASSPHAGDRWTNCEVESGRHGLAGYGIAVFYTDEVRPYWDSEIDAYMDLLREKVEQKKYSSIVDEQKKWEMQKRAMVEKVGKPNAKNQGTLRMVMYEGAVMSISRDRALRLGCSLEQPLVRQRKSRK